MENKLPDFQTILTTNHPARSYFILGGLLCGYGLLRNNLGGLITLVAGGALVARGFQEVEAVQQRHDGNAHGVNGTPDPQLSTPVQG